ncbi:MAG: hypothetical protein HS131_12085 [Ignavibacteriales bacterium]|jgi:hypothetical protein|nr:hypothetical protein [Ignavibacteriales bacterium]
MNIIQAQKNYGRGNHFVFLPERERESKYCARKYSSISYLELISTGT